IDTQITSPWVGEGSSDTLPLMTVQDILQLPDDKMGPALFDNPSYNLSRGAECFKDFLLNDFPADMMREDVETSSPLARVLRITGDLIRDLRGGLEEREKFLKSYEVQKMSAAQAASNVIEMAKAMGGDKGQRKKEHATMWCANELKKIDAKGAELADYVDRTSTSVGKKINSLLVHMKMHDLLSRTFVENLEAWQDLDAASAASAALQKPPVQADTPVVVNDPYADTIEMPEQARIEVSSVPFGNQQGTDDEAAALEASSVPIGNQGTDEEAAGNQGTDEEAAATIAPSVPLGNQGTEAAAVEAPSVAIGNQGTDEAAVEAPSVPVGNQGTEAAAVEVSSVPVGNQGTDEEAAAVDPIGNQGTDEEAAAVEAPSVPIGNQQGTEAPSVEVQSTQLDPEPALSAGTPKKHVSSEAVRLCRIATPQKDPGFQRKHDPVAIDSDAEDEQLMDEMLKTQFEADMDHAYMKREDGDGSCAVKHEPWLQSNGDDMSGMVAVVTVDDYMYVEPASSPAKPDAAVAAQPKQQMFEEQTSEEQRKVYKTYRTLVKEFGQEAADKIRTEKKSLQARLGNAYEDSPHWMKHPDLRDYEMYLVFDGATISSKAADKQETNLSANLSSVAAPLALNFLQPEQRNLARRDSQASLGSEQDDNVNNKKKKTLREPKDVNWVTKGKAKVNCAKAVVTESRCLRRTIDKAQTNDATAKSEDMVKGYKSELDMYTKQLEDAIEPLESKIADGEKSEKSLKPLMDELAKSVENFHKKVKTIKTAYDFAAMGAEPGRMLAGLASAGANGDHVSNIERDVLRRSTPSQVPIRFVPAPVRRKRQGAWVVEIAASFNYCLLGAAPTYLDAAELRPENVEAHELWVAPPGTLAKDRMNVRLAMAYADFTSWGRVVMAWLSDFVLGFRATLPPDARSERLDEMAKVAFL
ncbi:CLE-4A-2, partial [Symbiodinium sp. CCMP2456]